MLLTLLRHWQVIHCLRLFRVRIDSLAGHHLPPKTASP